MRFIGCKENLLGFIETFVKQKDIRGNTFCDLFAGTGSVAKHFKKLGYKIISSDLLYFSYVLQKVYIEQNRYPKFDKLLKYLKIDPVEETLFTSDSQSAKEVIKYLNNLAGVEGFIYNNYSPEGTKGQTNIRKYFTGIIDSSMKLDIYPVNPRIYSSQEEETENKKKTQRSVRIIADHMKAATFLIKDGVIPSNKLGGYILRRLLRRSAVKLYFLMKKNIILTEDLINLSNFHRVSDAVIDIYGGLYFDPVNDKKWIGQIVDDEIDNFRKTLEEGIRALKKIFNRAFGGIDPENLSIGMRLQNNRIRVSGAEVFKNYETFGLPPEIQQEIMTEWGLAFDSQTVKEYEEAMQHHQQVSRGVEAGKFKGGLVDHSEIVTKYHTATHLLHQALRCFGVGGVSERL